MRRGEWRRSRGRGERKRRRRREWWRRRGGGDEEERRHSIRRASRGRTEVGQTEEENEGEKALLRTYTSTKHVTESLFCFPIKHI